MVFHMLFDFIVLIHCFSFFFICCLLLDQLLNLYDIGKCFKKNIHFYFFHTKFLFSNWSRAATVITCNQMNNYIRL